MLTARGRVALTLALFGGCHPVSEPTSPLQFSLTTIDNQPLPRAAIGWSPDQAIEAAQLDFGVIAGLTDGIHGTVAFTIKVAGQMVTTPFSFDATGSILHIAFCAIPPNCGVVPTELSGPVAGDVLVLTYRNGGAANSVFRFDAGRSNWLSFRTTAVPRPR